MKQFFLKKSIFAAVFLGCWMVFSLANVIYGAGTWAELGQELLQVRSVSAMEDWIDEVESQANETILGHKSFIETFGYTQELLAKREFNQFAIIKDYDGMLYYGSTWPQGLEGMEEYANRVLRMKEYVESRGAKLLVVFPPSKVLTGVSEVDRELGINDPNPRIDKMVNLLYQRDVEVLDLRVKLRKTGSSLEELFFKTDHHWTPLAGFYTAQEIVDQVKLRFGDDWDPDGFYMNLENYQQYTYRNAMLGSNGRNAGAVYSRMEDFTMLWPTFDTDFLWEEPDRGNSREGVFTESLMNQRSLVVNSVYNGTLENLYLKGISDQDIITNRTNPDGPKLRVLRDSYFSPVACFLAPMCSEIDMIWTRAEGSEFDSETFVRKEGDFDYLILEIYPYNLDDQSFNFFQEP